MLQRLQGHLLTCTLAATPISVFSAGSEGYAIYRIPSVVRLTASNAPTTLLAFAEGRGSLADVGENDLVVKSSSDDGATWSALRVVCDMPARSLNNPCSVEVREGIHRGRVLLMFQSYPSTASEARVLEGFDATDPASGSDMICRTYTMYSDDRGTSWSVPREVTREVKRAKGVTSVATGPGGGIQLRRGAHRFAFFGRITPFGATILPKNASGRARKSGYANDLANALATDRPRERPRVRPSARVRPPAIDRVTGSFPNRPRPRRGRRHSRSRRGSCRRCHLEDPACPTG